MNKTEHNKQIALKWVKAFNEHDIEKLLELYSEDAVHYSPKLKVRHPETNGWVAGKAALRNWWVEAFKRLPSLHYQLENLIINDKQLLMEYLRQVEGEDEIMIAEILETEDNLIVRSRVYHG